MGVTVAKHAHTDMPENTATLTRDYGENRQFDVTLTCGGFVKVKNESGEWTKVSLQAFSRLDGSTVGVIQSHD